MGLAFTPLIHQVLLQSNYKCIPPVLPGGTVGGSCLYIPSVLPSEQCSQDVEELGRESTKHPVKLRYLSL